MKYWILDRKSYSVLTIYFFLMYMQTQHLCCYCRKTELQLPYINEAETVSLSINVLSNGNSLPCN